MIIQEIVYENMGSFRRLVDVPVFMILFIM